VRLLSNLESNRHKLLQMVLFGQPELDATLAKPGLRQLRDRITNAFRMRPLAAPEVAKYLSFRMRAAGYRGPDVFSPGAVRKLARASSGLTRRINILADKSLLAAFTDNAHAVTEQGVKAAIADAEFAAAAPRRRGFGPWYAAAALAAGVVIGIAATSQTDAPQPKVMAAAPPPPRPEPLPVKEVVAVKEVVVLEKLLTQSQAERLSKYSPGRQQLLRERIAATQERLERTPDERYSIEFFVTDNTDPARMERFLLRARELLPLDEVLVIPLMRGSDSRLRVAYGEFASREEALEARRRLPARYLGAFTTSLRSFAELRGQI
jgi:MSHA biogenesis protein MshM